MKVLMQVNNKVNFIKSKTNSPNTTKFLQKIPKMFILTTQNTIKLEKINN